MNRAERIHRTETIVSWRDRQWRSVISQPPRRPGRARKLSHFDCGKPRCSVCSQETARPRMTEADELEEFYLGLIVEDAGE